MTVNRGWSAEADKLLDYLVRRPLCTPAYMLTPDAGEGYIRRNRAPVPKELHLRHLS